MIKITDIWNPKFNEFVEDVENNISQIEIVIIDALHEADYSFNNNNYFNRLLKITSDKNIPIIIPNSGSKENEVQVKQHNVKTLSWETFWFRRTYMS